VEPFGSPTVEPTRPVSDRWRIWLVGYLVWLVLFAVVEGAGRQACRVPMQKWIAAAPNVRERTLREWTRDRAKDCLDGSAWYSYSIGTLFTIGLLAPFAVVWAIKKQVLRFGVSQPLFKIKTAEVLYGAVLVAAVMVSLGSMEAIRWLYDWAG